MVTMSELKRSGELFSQSTHGDLAKVPADIYLSSVNASLDLLPLGVLLCAVVAFRPFFGVGTLKPLGVALRGVRLSALDFSRDLRRSC